MAPVLTDPSSLTGRAVEPAKGRRFNVFSGFWPRMALVGVLSVAAHIFIISDVVDDAIAGSRAVIVIVLPILTAMIAAGHRHAPRGVVDAESDWIIAVLVGAAGLVFMELLSNRFPTFAGLWRFDLVSIAIWVAASATVMFGVRYVTQTWDVWVFAVSCASPLPFLLTTSLLGGSDQALAAQACALSAIAVFLAGRAHPMRWRVATAATSFAVGLGVSVLLLALWQHRLALLVAVVGAAGVIPVIAVGVLLLVPFRGASRSRPPVEASFPQRSPVSIIALVALAVVVMVLHPPVHHPGMPSARADWITRGALVRSAEFDFITRFLGPGATFIRYTPPPSRPKSLAVAVDVISSPNPGALADLDDAIWYPNRRPLNYQPITLESAPTVNARSAHTDGDAAVSEESSDWYALTWEWHVPDGNQLVTVLVAQQADGRLPEPTPITLAQIATGPAAWVARQQPDPIDYLAPRVTETGESVSRELMVAAGLADA